MLRAVVVDVHEPAWVHKMRPGGLVPTVQPLTVGDAWLAVDDACLIVERKTVSDLCSSIADGRLLNQVAAMRKTSEWCFVCVTELPIVSNGKLVVTGHPSGWAWKSVQGALLTAQELGVGVIWCAGNNEYATTLEWLADRKRGPSHIAARRDAIMETPAERILTALPGVAISRVTALLQHCGSAAWALDFLTGDGGGEVPGIGPKTKEAIREALGLPEDMYLAVMERGDR